MTSSLLKGFRRVSLCALVGCVPAVIAVASSFHGASAAAAIDLGTAANASVLAGAGVTNTGPTVLPLDLDTSPNGAITGFPPGLVLGTQHAADAVAAQAQSDLTTAYNAAAAAPSTNDVTGVDLGGATLLPGVYTASSSMAITGPLPLTLNGDASAVFIFQAGSTLITGPNSSILLTGGASACNVFWQVGSSATLDVGTRFIGNILALTSITLNTAATVDGRVLAMNGAVTLDSNVFTDAACVESPPASSTTTIPPPSTTIEPSTTIVQPSTTMAPPTTIIQPSTTMAPPTTTIRTTTTTIRTTTTTMKPPPTTKPCPPTTTKPTTTTTKPPYTTTTKPKPTTTTTKPPYTTTTKPPYTTTTKPPYTTTTKPKPTTTTTTKPPRHW